MLNEEKKGIEKAMKMKENAEKKQEKKSYVNCFIIIPDRSLVL